MMKQFLLITAIGCVTIQGLQAQNIGIGTATPHASAALDISSATRGLLAPRMTTAQRNAIATPAKGLLVYDTDLNGLHHFNGTSWTAVGGGGGIALPYSGSVSNASPALRIINIGDGEAISGSSTSSFTAAIEGTANGTGGYGVVGNSSSASGYGIYGTNPTGTAVYGFSVNGGVALRGNSPTGLALLTNGNLRLTGGNTNPSKGAVLTSVDDLGNAVWKENRVAFSARLSKNQSIAANVERKIEFGGEAYDISSDYSLFQGTATEATSVFTAPANGVYHFSSKVNIFLSSITTNFEYATISLIKNGAVVAGGSGSIENVSDASYSFLSVADDLRLVAGDKIWISVKQSNSGNLAASSTFSVLDSDSWFSGHLVFAD